MKWDKPTQIGETANNQNVDIIAKKTQDLLMKQSKSLLLQSTQQRCA